VTRIALGIQYAGTSFYGWQRQAAVRTVQEALESALSKVADEEIRVNCAGRTDRGVHAIEQVVHFETSKVRPDKAWLLGTNGHLPNEVGVCWVRKVSDDFHARFSALSRTYRYIILNQRARPALWSGNVAWEFEPLDVERMHRASQSWLGEHDFSAFRAASCQSNSPYRNVEYFHVGRSQNYVVITVRANAFLHHMVRNFVGTLIEIGRGRQEPSWAEYLLKAKKRELAAKTALPDGLYLLSVKYPSEFDIPSSDHADPALFLTSILSP